MVNGSLGKILYLGAWVCVILCVIGQVAIALSSKIAPASLDVITAACFGLLGGAHIMPVSTKAIEPDPNDPSRRIVRP